MKLQKHKIIAQAFAQRRKFNQGGRISIECQNHTDPVGLHFELNSAVSNELSTTWAANLPRLVNRRGAVPNEVTCSISSNNQSVDSEMSYSVRHVSIESRRNSGDSQLSVQIAELKATRKVNGRRHRNRLRRKHDFKRSSRASKNGTRRESSTSLDSHFGAAQLLNALTTTSNVKSIGPNMNRRTGNAGLDGQHINNLLSNGKLVIPYNVNMRSGSEDENVSVTISESKFNVVLSNHNLDLNDQLVMKSLRQDLNIESSSDGDQKDKDQEKRYSRTGRDSRSSRRSKRSRRSRLKYSSHSDSLDDHKSPSASSSCPELKQLVQSSLNSGVSVGGGEKSRGSKQSKVSIDVAVQANARDIVTQTAAFEMQDLLKDEERKYKSKQAKTKENKKYKKYKEFAQSEEFEPLRKDSNRLEYSESDDDVLIKDKHKVKVRKSKECY